jgi:L-alanine-DL-glutamate epimerase-like enolase superfamily enzyme
MIPMRISRRANRRLDIVGKAANAPVYRVLGGPTRSKVRPYSSTRTEEFTLQPGTEWAATGKVTQKIPNVFPTATVVAYRTDIAAMDPNYKYGLNALSNPPMAGGATRKTDDASYSCF